MKYIFFIFSIIISTSVFAQEKGIQFEKGTWKEVVAKAKKENKMIYVDFFTTWCGPCKLMSSKYFIDEKAGVKYNPTFVNFKIDAEKGEGVELAKKYNVTGYPTNIFIDSKTEKIIYKTMGCPIDVSGLIENADVAILEKKDPMSIEEYEAKFKSNKYDESFLKKYISKNNRLGKLNDTYVDEYFSQYSEKMTDLEKYNFISANEESLTAKIQSFNYLQTLINKNIVPNDKIQQTTESLVYHSLEKAEKSNNEKELLEAAILMKNYYTNGYEYSFEPLEKFYIKNKNEKRLEELYNEYGNYFSNIKPEVFDKKNKDAFESNVDAKMSMLKFQGGEAANITEGEVRQQLIEDGRNRIYSVSTANNLNSICWNIYEKMSANKSLLESSLNWIQTAMQLTDIDIEEWAPIADTYAHLLVVSGKKQEAIQQMKHIIKMTSQNKIEDVDSYKKYLKELEKK